MSSTLETIAQHFGYYTSFTPRELSDVLNKNQKVVSMVLKKYANIEVLGFFSELDRFYLRDEDDILKCRKKTNDLIDKYNLKQKKYKL